jgi:hypothetical protein
VPASADHIVTSGTFSLDGGTWDADNNVFTGHGDETTVGTGAPHLEGWVARGG